MQAFKLKAEIIEKIDHCLKSYREINAAIIHGSRVHGQARPDSDLDLSVLSFNRGTLTLETEKKLYVDLDAFLPYELHLSHLSHDSLPFTARVLQLGELIHLKDKYHFETFQMYAFSYYAKLNEDREEILNAYRS